MDPSHSPPPLNDDGTETLDDLFDYDVDLNDPFSENYVVPASKDKSAGSKGKDGAGLGIDEAIEVTRKPRAPRVKLDENKLLGAAGIPKLRKRAADHLKFKGKGHEYSDAARLLAFYQLWLDDLFPKAKFLDALAMVEKLGHKKMIQAARMNWINEGKPKDSVHEDSLVDEPELPLRENNGREKTAERVAPIFEQREGRKTPVPDFDTNDEDLYNATPRVVRRQPETEAAPSISASIFGDISAKNGAPTDDTPPDDDLEALLAEEEASNAAAKPAQSKPVVRPMDDGPLDDDLEALLAEEEEFNAAEKSKEPKVSENRRSENDDMDEMDAMEAMADMDMDMNW